MESATLDSDRTHILLVRENQKSQLAYEIGINWERQ